MSSLVLIPSLQILEMFVYELSFLKVNVVLDSKFEFFIQAISKTLRLLRSPNICQLNRL